MGGARRGLAVVLLGALLFLGGALPFPGPFAARTAAAQSMGICDRTQGVQDAILKALKSDGVSNCAAVTAAHLASIVEYLPVGSIVGSPVPVLEPGDFAGLNRLKSLWVYYSGPLSDLSGVFSGLGSLIHLTIRNTDSRTSLPAGLLTGLRDLRSLQIASYSHSLPAGFFAGSRQLRAVTFSVGSFAARPGSSLDVSLEEGGSDHCFKVEILQGAPIRTAVRYKATVRPPAPGAAYDDNNFDTRASIEAGDTQSGDICVPSRQADGNHAEGTKITVVLTEPSFAQYSVSGFMDGLYYSDVAPLNLQVGDKSSHTDAAIYLGPDREQEGEILKFPVRLTRSVSSDVTVLWKTADETAKAPGDYMAVSNGSLTIKAGDTKGVIEVRTVEDTERERHETLKVLFDTAATSLPAGVVFGNTEAQGTIGNDDTGVTFQGDGSCSIREGGEHTINVVLSHDVVLPIAVIISAVGGTAGSGDYSLQGGSILLHEFTTTFLITTQAKRNLSSRSGIGGVLSAT